MELVEDDGEVGLSRSNFGDISLLHTDISQWEPNLQSGSVKINDRNFIDA